VARCVVPRMGEVCGSDGVAIGIHAPELRLDASPGRAGDLARSRYLRVARPPRRRACGG
jgi:hypothetical protein